ncbi:MAG: hypothetical protein ACKO86_14850, partial [Dolichospermum sp.]
IMVPLFIAHGERIKLDTREDKYLGRESFSYFFDTNWE